MARLGKKDNEQIIKELLIENKILEKENAELKSGCGMCYRKDKEQLTKAKEYIKLLLMNCVGVYESTGKTVAEIQAEAEQFLKGE